MSPTRTAIVFGGSSGIGKATASLLAADGVHVVVQGLLADEVAVAVADLGASVSGAVCDVRVPAQVDGLVAETLYTRGAIDMLVYSVGVQTYGTAVDTTEELWQRTIDVNAGGALRTIRAVLPSMRERRTGSIVIISSVQSHASQNGVVAYAASKGALAALVRAVAVDEASFGIRINAVSPAAVDTPMLREEVERFRQAEQSPGELLDLWGRDHPLGRVAAAREVAEVAVFLAGPRASFVTGADVLVDGGLLSRLGVPLGPE